MVSLEKEVLMPTSGHEAYYKQSWNIGFPATSPHYRVICSCHWEGGADSQEAASQLYEDHLGTVHPNGPPE